MIYVRSWDAHCPALFSAPTLKEARSIASRLGYTDVWYDTNGTPNEAQELRLTIKELEGELESTRDQRDEALEDKADHEDCEQEIAELEQTVDTITEERDNSNLAVKQLAAHLDLMQAIVKQV